MEVEELETADSPEKKAEGWKPVRRAQDRNSRGLWSVLFPVKGGTRSSSSPRPGASAAPPLRAVVRRELGIVGRPRNSLSSVEAA